MAIRCFRTRGNAAVALPDTQVRRRTAAGSSQAHELTSKGRRRSRGSAGPPAGGVAELGEGSVGLAGRAGGAGAGWTRGGQLALGLGRRDQFCREDHRPWSDVLLRYIGGDELDHVPVELQPSRLSVLIAAIQEVGVDNVMFSIDYPFESTEKAVQFIRTAPLAPADQARVAHVNAERILRLNQ
jgi:hypothetical protein